MQGVYRWTPKAGCELPTRRAQIRRQNDLSACLLVGIKLFWKLEEDQRRQNRARPEAGTPGGGVSGGGGRRGGRGWRQGGEAGDGGRGKEEEGGGTVKKQNLHTG